MSPRGSGTGLPPGAINPQRPSALAPQRTIPHEAHRDQPPPIPNPQSIEPKPPPRAPTLTALKGPLPEDPIKLWEMVIGACATQHRMRMLVGNMKLLKVDNDLALLQVPEELRPTAATAQQELSNIISTAWGQPVRVELLSPSPSEGGRSGSAAAESGRDGETPTTQQAAVSPANPAPAPQPAPSDIASHPLIKQAIDLFGAKVIGVQARRKQAE